MTENMKKLLEELSKHEEMKERASAVRTKEEVMKLADELGVPMTEDDLCTQESSEVSEEELATAAGGGGRCFLFGYGTEGCVCIVAGTAWGYFCVAYGVDIP